MSDQGNYRYGNNDFRVVNANSRYRNYHRGPYNRYSQRRPNRRYQRNTRNFPTTSNNSGYSGNYYRYTDNSTAGRGGWNYSDAQPGCSKDSDESTSNPPKVVIKPDPVALLDEEISAAILEFCEKIKNASEHGPVIIQVSEKCNLYCILQYSFSSDVEIPKTVQIVKGLELNHYSLKVNNDELVKGQYSSLKEAKVMLPIAALEKLSDHCFVLYNKEHFLTVDKNLSNTNEIKLELREPIKDKEGSIESSLSNSVAYRMMKNMGWKGGGLGIREQGIKESIQTFQNISRYGFGEMTFKNSVAQLLTDFKESKKHTCLHFNKGYSKEERELIHKCGIHLGLKTRSYGRENNRYITVYKKLSKIEIIKELLRVGGENDYYKLTVPKLFQEEYQNMKEAWKVKEDLLKSSNADDNQ